MSTCNNVDLVLKQGDTYGVRWYIGDGDGRPVNLTGASVTLTAKRGQDPSIDLPVTIPEPTEGWVRWIWGGNLTVGTYAVEAKVTRGEEIVSAPTTSFAHIRVIADLS